MHLNSNHIDRFSGGALAFENREPSTIATTAGQLCKSFSLHMIHSHYGSYLASRRFQSVVCARLVSHRASPAAGQEVREKIFKYSKT